MGCLIALLLLAVSAVAGYFALYFGLGEVLCDSGDCPGPSPKDEILLVVALMCFCAGGGLGIDRFISWWRGDDLRSCGGGS